MSVAKDSIGGNFYSIVKLMRVKHYLKNVLIFLPIVFGGQMLNPQLLPRVFWGFVAFSLISSCVYIINDIRDAPQDRLHPTKRERPIASGALSPKQGAIIFVCCIILAGVANYVAVPRKSLWPWVLICSYFVLNLLYCMWLKNIAIVDIAILVSGFLLRVLYGAAVTQIQISNWMYLTVIAISFYLGMGKRRNELMTQSDKTTRKVLKDYNYSFLDKNMYLCLTLAIVFYALWSVDSLTIARMGHNYTITTVPLIMLLCLRYSLIVEGQSDGDPIEIIFKDKLLLLLTLVLGLLYFILLYL